MSGRYYCHQCSIEIEPTNVPTDPTCPSCSGGFIEEMEMSPGGALGAMAPIAVREVNPLSPFMGLFGPPSHSHGHSHGHSHDAHSQNPHGGTYVFRMRSSAPGARGSGGGIEFHFDSGASGSSDGAFAETGGQADQPRPVGLEAIFNLLGSLGVGGLGMPSTVHGNPGDYVWGAGGLDAIITQLLNNVEGAGPPPADPEKIENLPTVKINSIQVDNNVQCFVCFDDFTLDEEVKVLPCRHHYHKDCIIPWLERHGTCPVCRKDLNGSDTTTTEFDANIGETIGSLETPDREPGDGALTPESMETQTTSSMSRSAAEPSGSNTNNSAVSAIFREEARDDDVD